CEAGGIIWRDGGILAYLRGGSPMAPEANFVRDVDFCSTAFLLLRATLLQELDGFDAAFGRSGHADADVCVRVAAAGYRVVYDPNVSVYRLDDGAIEAGDTDAVAVFARKHADHLQSRGLADAKAEVFARAVGAHHPRVLFIEDLVPLRR